MTTPSIPSTLVRSSSPPPPKKGQFPFLQNMAAKRTWQQVTAKGTAPSGRWGHSAVVFGSSMFIFGGCNESSPALNQLFQFYFRITPSPRPHNQCQPTKQIENRKESMEGDQIRELSCSETQSFRSDPQQWNVHLWRIYFNGCLCGSSPLQLW